MLRKNEKKSNNNNNNKKKEVTAKKYLIVCALPETDHINSFQVDIPSPCHLRTFKSL